MLSHATRDGFPRSLSHIPTTIPPTGGDGTIAGTSVDLITFAKLYSTAMGGGMLSHAENFALDLVCIEAETFCKKSRNTRPLDHEVSQCCSKC
jgi:hypothetical protein